MCVFDALRLNSFMCYDFVHSVLNSFQVKMWPAVDIYLSPCFVIYYIVVGGGDMN